VEEAVDLSQDRIHDEQVNAKYIIYLVAITNKPLQMEPHHMVRCEICGSHGTVCEDDDLLGCDVVHSGRQAPPFWRNMLPLCSWQS